MRCQTRIRHLSRCEVWFSKVGGLYHSTPVYTEIFIIILQGLCRALTQSGTGQALHAFIISIIRKLSISQNKLFDLDNVGCLKFHLISRVERLSLFLVHLKFHQASCNLVIFSMSSDVSVLLALCEFAELASICLQ